MTLDPTYPFLVVLALYLVYSEWAGMDSRYPIVGALLLVVITAFVEAAGATSDANVLAPFVFYLLVGGVLLLLVDHLREERARAPRSPPRSGKAPAPPEKRSPTTNDGATTSEADPAAGAEAVPPAAGGGPAADLR